MKVEVLKMIQKEEERDFEEEKEREDLLSFLRNTRGNIGKLLVALKAENKSERIMKKLE